MSLETIGPTRTSLPRCLRLVHGLVDEPEVRRRRVRLAADVVGRGRVGGGRRERDDQVAHRQVGLEPAAGADAHQLLDPELDELLDHDRGRGAAHPARLDGDGLALEGARVAEHPALGVPLDDVLQERLRDVLGPERVAGQEARLGVVSRVRTHVDWHGREPRRCIRSMSARCGRDSSSPRPTRCSPTAPRSRSSASSSRTSRGAAPATSPRSSVRTARCRRSATSARTSSPPARDARASPSWRRGRRHGC